MNSLHDSCVHIEQEGKSNLLVTFGGISQGIGVPVFEFFRSLSHIDCDKVFLRDPNQSWYQQGVSESLPSPRAIELFLREIIAQGKYDKVCLIGNSMGGHAAIHFGLSLDVDQVIAFAPQTFINRFQRIMRADTRWRPQIKRTHANTSNSELFDLKRFARKFDQPKTKIRILYSPTHRLDRTHAKRMRLFEFVNLEPINEGGHGVVKTVRDRGELASMVEHAFAKGTPH